MEYFKNLVFSKKEKKGKKKKELCNTKNVI